MLHLSNFNGLLVEFCPSVCHIGRLVEQNAAKWRPVSLGSPAGLSRCKNQLSEWARGCLRWWAHSLCRPDSVRRETFKKWQNKDDFAVLRWKRGSICADLGILEDVMAGGQFFQLLVRNSNCLIVLFQTNCRPEDFLGFRMQSDETEGYPWKWDTEVEGGKKERKKQFYDSICILKKRWLWQKGISKDLRTKFISVNKGFLSRHVKKMICHNQWESCFIT